MLHSWKEMSWELPEHSAGLPDASSLEQTNHWKSCPCGPGGDPLCAEQGQRGAIQLVLGLGLFGPHTNRSLNF